MERLANLKRVHKRASDEHGHEHLLQPLQVPACCGGVVHRDTVCVPVRGDYFTPLASTKIRCGVIELRKSVYGSDIFVATTA